MLLKMLEFCNANGIDPTAAHVIYQVYLHLIEVGKWWDVGWDGKDKFLFCTAKRVKGGDTKYVIPVLITEALTVEQIERYQNIFNSNGITLAILSPNSTITYYEVNKGLTTKNPEEIEKSHSDSFIRANHKKLLSEAQRRQQTDDNRNQTTAQSIVDS